MLAVIEQANWLAGQHGARKQEKSHIRAAPRAIYSKEAQAGGRQAIEVAVAVCHQLVGSLGGSVELQRVAGAVFLTKGHLGVGAIDTAGAGVGQMWCMGLTTGFKDIGESDDVALHVTSGVVEGVTHTGLDPVNNSV